MQQRIRNLPGQAGGSAERLRVSLVTDGDTILPTHNGRVQRIFARVLAERGIEVRTAARVTEMRARAATFEDGTEIGFDAAVWVTSASAAPWLKETGLALDPSGFVLVDTGLQSISHGGLFAAGDVASIQGVPRPKSGVFAVRQGPLLARNLRRFAEGKPLMSYRPQARFLSLISTGDRGAVASRGRWAAEGALVWRWKDRIDRRFMRRFGDLPRMPIEGAVQNRHGSAPEATTLPGSAMRCGGCGAKIGAPVLKDALLRLRQVDGGSPSCLPDLWEDAAARPLGNGRVQLQSVDLLRSFLDDPYVLGEITANHALSDIFARGGTPVSALAIAMLPVAAPAKVAEDLFQMMAGAKRALTGAGVELIGGHTSEGEELALGFAVTGSATDDDLLGKGGLRPGDRLILTKPLGVGLLLAARMRRRAKGAWVEGAIACMRHSNGKAASILRRHGARASTDVTGFGLAGHLGEMLEASKRGADLRLSTLPTLEGALDAAAQGIASSLAPENRRAHRAVDVPGELAGSPRYALLFDPQTSGGLLAGVPARRAGPCVDELRAAGYPHAAEIGEVTAGPELLRVRS
jgi:selenide, water dikinase